MAHNIQECLCVVCENLRRDAERYRYLRDMAGNFILEDLAAESPSHWDAIVDEYRGVQMGDGSARTSGEANGDR